MAGAEQLSDMSFILVPAGAIRPGVQHGCARGTVLHCTVVLAEGATSAAGEEAVPQGP
jgi:hypothetical protein